MDLELPDDDLGVLKLPDLKPPEEDLDELDPLDLELPDDDLGVLKLPDLKPPEEDLDELDFDELNQLELDLELPGKDLGVLKLPDLKPPEEDFELLNPLDLKPPLDLNPIAYTTLLFLSPVNLEITSGVIMSTEINKNANIKVSKKRFFFIFFTPQRIIVSIGC